MVNTAAQAGMVLFITSTASTFLWSLTIAKMPQKIAAGFGALHGSAALFMIATIVTCSICDTTMENASRHMAPYLVVVVIGLLLVAFVPWFSLVVPGLLGMN